MADAFNGQIIDAWAQPLFKESFPLYIKCIELGTQLDVSLK